MLSGLAAALFGAPRPGAARGGPAPPEYYYPPTAGGGTATMVPGLPDPVVARLGEVGLPLGALGLFVQAVDQPLPLLSLNAEDSYVLASTAKVVTTLAALDLLGPNYRWRTEAHLHGELVDGRLDGDLVILGGGNARLGSDDLLRWFEAMQAQGLREIGGNIVLDRLAFQLSERDQAAAPRPAPDRPHHNWPDALSLNDGVLRLQLQAAAAGRPQVELVPPLADVTVLNQVVPGRGCATQVHWSGDAGDGARELRVTGQWGPACGPSSVRFALMSDADLTARAVQAAWVRAGGVLQGRVVDRAVPQAGPVRSPERQRDARGVLRPAWATHLSDPLPLLVREINKYSDNMAARALMLSLSPGFPAQAATPEAARSRVQQWMRTRGLPPGDLEVDTGSGLSRAERGKPRALVQLLRQAWHDRNGRWFVDSLPIAGVDGTLANRLRDGPATGRAMLKTGSLMDVRAVAGYVRSQSGRVYAVSAIVNHPDAPAATVVLDALVDWLALRNDGSRR
ncbi:D-alanyl-D-alanine carboxypeptidase [Piscinibacter sakaiensis]|uniref:D-alanyl-D-alanine carboxypeptidase n=1 Tax=Piscinibacter sakaiensis TaxID=1547922 RepID=A0A0K8NX08_PISS1|nr:D-alanyl-D-alanine carboxypeptidase [Piscinibacter sakaiensis]